MGSEMDLNGEHTQSVELTNSSSVEITVYVEPWGDEFVLVPQDSVTIVISGSYKKAIPISYTADSIVVEGWEYTTAEIWKDGVRLN